jgi:hypothetical protein
MIFTFNRQQPVLKKGLSIKLYLIGNSTKKSINQRVSYLMTCRDATFCVFTYLDN